MGNISTDKRERFCPQVMGNTSTDKREICCPQVMGNISTDKCERCCPQVMGNISTDRCERCCPQVMGNISTNKCEALQKRYTLITVRMYSSRIERNNKSVLNTYRPQSTSCCFRPLSEKIEQR
jgi:hypothetical protein